MSNFSELIVLQAFAAHDRDKREPTRGPVNEFEQQRKVILRYALEIARRICFEGNKTETISYKLTALEIESRLATTY